MEEEVVEKRWILKAKLGWRVFLGRGEVGGRMLRKNLMRRFLEKVAARSGTLA